MSIYKPDEVAAAFKKMYEFIICVYIIIVPIINSLNHIAFFGYGLHIWVSVLLLIMTAVVNILGSRTYKLHAGLPLLVFAVFAIELLYQLILKQTFEAGTVFCILLYAAFLLLPKGLSFKKIYSAYYIAVIVAAIYSVFWGNADSEEVVRTATKVDGSISLIVLLIVFWAKEPFDRTRSYTVLKYLAAASCFIVSLYGMSRSRLLILAIIILVKGLSMVKNTIKNGKIRVSTFLMLQILLIVLLFISRMEFTNNLLGAISARFESGFESLGRDDEIEVGIRFFLEKPVLGNGWGPLFFTDYQNYYSNYFNHCMYIAFLVRGGILMGAVFAASFVSLIIKVLKRKDFYCICAAAVFFILGYGNAGVFNYTICGMMIPLALVLNSNEQSSKIGDESA